MANLGIGAWGISEKKLKLVADFFEEFISPEPLSSIGGLIPVHGMRERIVGSNFLLVGDAAGLADPVTGAGIANAWECAISAGDTIADFLNGKIESLSIYEEKLKLLRKSLERSQARRFSLEYNWCDEERFVETIRKNWIPTAKINP